MLAARNPPSRLRRLGGGLLVTAFGGLFLYFLLPEILSNLAAANWTLTPCTILSSRVGSEETHDGDERRTLYRLDVRYSYRSATGRRESTRYRFIDPFTDNRAAVEAAAARYVAGAETTCYVDPDDSANAVLDRRLSPFMLIVLLPAAIAALGLWNLVELLIDVWRGS